MNNRIVLKSTTGHQQDQKRSDFPAPTPYQVAQSVLDDLTEALEERRTSDRRVSNKIEPTRIERRKAQRRKSI